MCTSRHAAVCAVIIYCKADDDGVEQNKESLILSLI